jgi:FAD/FMN-containing dehydrogenase
MGETAHGETFVRGHEGYEAARRAAVANARTPDREPEMIVRARTEEEVVAAVELAGQRGWQIGVRSGGHSWSGNHLREGGLLIDLSEMTEVTVDAETRTATVQPGRRSSELAAQLSEQGLFFPTGHCVGPAVGGFLLQGGFGWNSRRVGPACMSVTAIDVVTADGELVRAGEDDHADLFWAARGGGPGFFGVVTRFHLKLHERPPVQMSSVQLYDAGLIDEVMRWAHAVAPSVPKSIELMVFLRRGLMGDTGPALQVLAPVLADSEEEAREDLAFLEESPLRGRTLAETLFLPTDVREMVAESVSFYPEGFRYAVDNMWTHATVDDLLPGYRRIVETLPDSPSHMMWMNWAPGAAKRPEMAFSLEDQTYIGLYGVWLDAADDARFQNWATDRMREMEPLAAGVQLADENLGRRPARFVADAALRRLDEVRAHYDPEGRFHSWMGRPDVV